METIRRLFGKQTKIKVPQWRFVGYHPGVLHYEIVTDESMNWDDFDVPRANYVFVRETEISKYSQYAMCYLLDVNYDGFNGISNDGWRIKTIAEHYSLRMKGIEQSI